MGFNPFKAVTKPFKKILRSPIGKAALGIGAFMYGPKLFGAQDFGGAGGWGQAWKGLPPWLMGTEGAIEGAVSPPGALGGSSKFGKYVPGVGNAWQRMGTLGKAATVGVGAAGAGALGDDTFEKSKTVIDTSGHEGYLNSREMYLDEWAKWLMDQDDTLSYEEAMEKVSDPLFEKSQGGLISLAQGGRIGMQSGNPNEDRARERAANQQRAQTFDAGMGQGNAGIGQGIQDAKEKYIDDMNQPQKYFVKGALGVDTREKKDYPSPTIIKPPVQHGGGGGGGGQGQPLWATLGYPSYEAWLAAQQSQGSGAGTGDTTGDYYGFDEWADWVGAPTTPLFGDTTKYKALLNQGGRIGLYAGGMGAMNSPMNPMMNQGLGAAGSQGMNPYNQQNLMQQAQMRGRPPMPGGPTTAQGPGLASLPPAKNEDAELLQLIKMLASMGIPMEQLRGRTKEELVEMVMSLSSKAQAQAQGGGGGEEVVEEQEEIVEASHGGRIHAAGGLGENRFGRHRFLNEEEEEIYIPRAQGGLMRSRYAMGTEQPIIPSRDGPQIDYRGIGGYQPHGAKEKKDDVRALLAQGEFVVTSDAVKGIGEGDRDVGAKRMYDMMHKYEPIGRALS